MKALKKVVIVVFLITFFYSCKHGGRLVEAGDKDMSVQLIRLDNNGGNDGGLSYKVRLIPDKKLLQGKGREERNKLLFKMDSCFYLVNGVQKIYASMVQPVANGVGDTYEYLLVFDEKLNPDSLTMVYQDKYISQKSYTLKLVKE